MNIMIKNLFRRRINRKYFIIGMVVFITTLSFLQGFIQGIKQVQIPEFLILLYWTLFLLNIIIIFLIWINRLHDINKSAWWIIPIGIWNLVFSTLDKISYQIAYKLIKSDLGSLYDLFILFVYLGIFTPFVILAIIKPYPKKNKWGNPPKTNNKKNYKKDIFKKIKIPKLDIFNKLKKRITKVNFSKNNKVLISLIIILIVTIAVSSKYIAKKIECSDFNAKNDYKKIEKILVDSVIKGDVGKINFVFYCGTPDKNIVNNVLINSISYKEKYKLKNTSKSINELIKNGADVNVKFGNNKTPIMIASEKGYSKIVKVLIENGADINAKDSKGSNSLEYAIAGNNTNTIKLLIYNGIDVNVKSKENNATAVMFAVLKGNQDALKMLIKAGADINTKTKNGKTAIIFSAMSGNVNITKILINKGANVNSKDKKGNNSLMFASANGNYNIARLLINAGADIDTQNNNGNTALILATMQGNIKMVEFLIKQNANVNLKNKKNKNAMSYAYSKNDTELSKVFQNNGAYINSKDPIFLVHDLLLAIINRDEYKVKQTIKLGADVNHRSTKGITPLMNSVKNYNITKILIESGADVNAKDINGYSVLAYAIVRGNKNVVKLLIKNGAKISKRKPKETPDF